MSYPISNLDYGVWDTESQSYNAAFATLENAFLWKFCQLKPGRFQVKTVSTGGVIPDSMRSRKPTFVLEKV